MTGGVERITIINSVVSRISEEDFAIVNTGEVYGARRGHYNEKYAIVLSEYILSEAFN